jgi:ATP-binding cassette subfamily B multidrug efflux pump
MPAARMGKSNGRKATPAEAKRSVRRLAHYSLTYYPFEFWMSIVCIVVSGLTGVLPMIFIGLAVDEINAIVSFNLGKSAEASVSFLGMTLNNISINTIGQQILVVAILAFIGLAANYFYNFLMSRLAQGVQKRIRDDLFNHMQDLPLSYFDTRTHGDIMSVYTNDVDTLREAMSRSWPMIVSGAVTVVAVAAAMFIYNWVMAILVLVITIPTTMYSSWISKKSGKYFVNQQIALAKTNGYVEEMTNGQRVIKVFNYEKRAEEAFDVVNDDLFEQSTKANRYANILMPIVNQIGNLQYVILAMFGYAMLVVAKNGGVNIGLTIGVVVSFLTLSKQFTQPIGQVAQQINSIAMALAGATRIFDLIDQPAEVDDGYVELCNAKEGPNGEPIEVKENTNHWAWKHPHKDGTPTTYVWLKGKIDFYDVDFAYVKGKTVLHDITLYAKPGQKVAFVGPTGAGKTTITNLINRFYDIADGKIRYDDININKIKKADLRRSLGMVLQDTELFTGMVKENIRYGKLDATDEEVVAAAKLANADSFIQQLPQGYDTVLTKAGLNLSQGQRQLLSIARAAIANPPVMILDEATSSIDSRTEKMVQEGMDAIMKGRTVFVIAHRLSTIKNADVIMVIDQGKIIERGSHDELMAKKGKYYQLYTGNAIAEAD